MFKSIVVGFDGSPHAARALQTGIELAGRDEARLGIIYVVDRSQLQIPEEMRNMGVTEGVIAPMSTVQIDFANAPETMMDTIARLGADSLKAMFQYADFLVGEAAEHARQAGVDNVETAVEQGDPAEEIAAYAADREADLIVCGSRGMGRWKSLLLGSTSSKLNQISGCSCLVVR
jgi:nucleotide-binding universal stress UspA family protein